MATDYGGTYGDPPWHGARPPYPGQPSSAELPPQEELPPHPAPAGPGAVPRGGGPTGWQRRSRVSFLIAVTALVLGLAGLAVSFFGVATQLLPRHFTAQQQQKIINWDFGQRWRDDPAGTIFPASATYSPPTALDGDSSLSLAVRRIGIAKQATCRAATDAAAAAILHRDGCADLLRATYADGTDSYVVTVGVAVMPSTAQASAAAHSLGLAADASGVGPGVHAVSFARTPAQWFTDQRRQLTGATAAGTYVVLYSAGYADSRPREPVSNDSYGDAEISAAAQGAAKAVVTVLGKAVPAPGCPGAPGC